MSDSLQLHGLQHTRLPCTSPIPKICSNSHPSKQWGHLILCHPRLCLPSVFPSHQGLFQWVSSLHQVAKVLEFQLQRQSFQWIFRTGFPWDWLVGSPCSPKDSQESSTTPQFKSINSSVLNFIVQLSHPYMTTGKTIVLTRWNFVGKVMSLLFNILARGSYISSRGSLVLLHVLP